MAVRPVIFTVDDEPEVLSAVERDLRRKYGREYQLVRAESGAVALDTLRQLKVRDTPVALFLVDQRMPQMTGVEFLSQAITIYPDAKRALLTAYADTEAAIRAINDIRLDFYLMKPWDPPDEKLYPVVDDLLLDWRANFLPEFEGARIVGHRWSPMTHALRDFLSRNQIPYHWLDLEINEQATGLLQRAGLSEAKLPVAIFPDGTSLVQPSNAEM